MAYLIREGDIAKDKKLLISLWERNFQEINEGRYAWIYENNSNGTPVIYLLEHEVSCAFVGAVSLFPRTIFINGRKVKAYICGDMVVDTDHRTLGPAISLLKAAMKKCQEDSPCVLISSPNQNSEPVVLRSGFKVLGEYYEMTRIIKTQRYLLRYKRFQAITRPLSLVLDLLLRLRYEIFFPISAKQYSCENADAFDERFNDLGDRAGQNFSFIGERDGQYLNWRIGASPYNRHKIFILKSKKANSIHGYIAFTVVDKRVHIADLGYDGDRENFKTLFFFFNKFQNKQGNHSIGISIATDAHLIDQLKGMGYLVREVKNKIVTFSSSEQVDLTSKISNGDWYLTPADNDI